MKVSFKNLKNEKLIKNRPFKNSTKFRRPKTKILMRNPKFNRNMIKSEEKKIFFDIIKNPLTTESAMKKIQGGNTIVFIVDIRSNKNKIKNSIKKLYKVKISKVNTLIQPNGKKKAFIKLSSDCDALDVANKIGFI
jgi:large subunit ribosomal protein L23Ae